MRELYAVDVTDFCYPCMRYVARRLGISYDDIMELYTHKRHLWNGWTNINYGDILVWDVDDPTNGVYPISITNTNLIISDYISVDFHMAVYEGLTNGNRLISDLTFDAKAIPFIRFRYADKLQSTPDYYIPIE